MALTNLTADVPAKLGGSGFENDSAILTAMSEAKALLKEVRELKVKAVAGDTAETNIAVAGILATATVVACFSLEPPTATGVVLVDSLMDELTVSAGQIQFATTNTTGKSIVIVYFNHA